MTMIEQQEKRKNERIFELEQVVKRLELDLFHQKEKKLRASVESAFDEKVITHENNEKEDALKIISSNKGTSLHTFSSGNNLSKTNFYLENSLMNTETKQKEDMNSNIKGNKFLASSIIAKDKEFDINNFKRNKSSFRNTAQSTILKNKNQN